MTFEERFDEIIDLIESNVKLRTYELLTKIEKSTGYSKRMITSIFSFVTGLGFDKYLKERKMESISKEYMNNKEISLADLSLEYGYSDQSAMAKTYKKIRGYSLTELKKKKDIKFQEPLYLRNILKGNQGELKMNNIIENNENMIFGIPETKYKAAEEALTLKSAYDLDDESAQQAYELAKKHKCKLSKAFEFVSEYYNAFYYRNGFISNTTAKLSINPLYEEIFFRKNLSVDDIDYLFYEFKAWHLELTYENATSELIRLLDESFSLADSLEIIGLFEEYDLNISEWIDLFIKELRPEDCSVKYFYDFYYMNIDTDWMGDFTQDDVEPHYEDCCEEFALGEEYYDSSEFMYDEKDEDEDFYENEFDGFSILDM